MAYNFTLLEPKEYADLHDFYQKVATADQQQFVLTRALQLPKEIDDGYSVFVEATDCRISVAAAWSVCMHAGFCQLVFERTACSAWGLDAAKDPVPDYAKDASAVILFDEYIETVDAQGRAVEREREAIRILKPQGRGNTCDVGYDEDEKVNYFRAWTIAADEKHLPGTGH